MAMEDMLSGATNAFAFYGAYLGTVAQEIGMERALALQTKMLEIMGAMQGGMMKEQAGVKDFDIKAAYSVVKAVPENLGIATEILEDTPTVVRFKCLQCSFHNGLQMAGLDEKTRETMCRDGAIKFMDTALKQLNPNLSYRLMKYRSSVGDFCEEAVVAD